VILADLAQADHAEAPRPLYRKRLHDQVAVEVAVVLIPVDFRPRGPVIRALDRPCLQIILITSPDRVGRWRDLERLEVPGNPLARFPL
jgi:hypothetical protein